MPQQKADGSWRVICVNCDAEIDPPRIGPFKILKLIGQGGFAEVYSGLLDHSTEPIAIKLLAPSYLSNEEMNRRFEREAAAVKRLRHPNICAVFDYGRDGDRSFIWMEYIQGETLRIAIPRITERKQDAQVWLDLVVQMAEGLCEAHRRGVIHRDIKPENIIITTKGVAKILDFGLARLEVPFNQVLKSSDPTLMLITAPGERIGTVAYMSPEQVRGEARVGEASDVFSFGIVLYEIFSCGQHPFLRASRDATIAAIVSESPALLRTVNPAAPRKLSAIIRKTLEKDPKRRYKTEELLQHLRRLQSRPAKFTAWMQRLARSIKAVK